MTKETKSMEKDNGNGSKDKSVSVSIFTLPVTKDFIV